MYLFTKIHQALQGIVARFKNGDIPKAVAISTFPVPNIPAAKWSLFDRTLMFIADTGDARGYRQWQIKLPKLPLTEVAENWGISVHAILGNYRCYGYFSQDRQEIVLATKEERVFFHELSHSARHRIIGRLQLGQDWKLRSSAMGMAI